MYVAKVKNPLYRSLFLFCFALLFSLPALFFGAERMIVHAGGIPGQLVPLGDQLGDVGQYYSQVDPSQLSNLRIYNPNAESVSVRVRLYPDSGTGRVITTSCTLSPAADIQVRTNVITQTGCAPLDSLPHGIYHATVIANGGPVLVANHFQNEIATGNPLVSAAYQAVPSNKLATTHYFYGLLERGKPGRLWTDTEFVVQNPSTTGEAQIQFTLCREDGVTCWDNNSATVPVRGHRIFLLSQLAYRDDNGSLIAESGSLSVKLTVTNGVAVATMSNLFRQAVPETKTMPMAEKGSRALVAFGQQQSAVSGEIAQFYREMGDAADEGSHLVQVQNVGGSVTTVTVALQDALGNAVTGGEVIKSVGMNGLVSFASREFPVAGGVYSARIAAQDGAPLAVWHWRDAPDGLAGDVWQADSVEALTTFAAHSQSEGWRSSQGRSVNFIPAVYRPGQGDSRTAYSQVGPTDFTWYLPFVPAPIVPFAWDTDDPAANLPGSRYALSGYIPSHLPDYVRDLNWYNWGWYAPDYFSWTDLTRENHNTTDPSGRYNRYLDMFKGLGGPHSFYGIPLGIDCHEGTPNYCNYNSPTRMQAIRNLAPSNAAGSPLLLANEPEHLDQGTMTYPEMARMLYIFRQWSGDLYSPAFGSHQVDGYRRCGENKDQPCPTAEGVNSGWKTNMLGLIDYVGQPDRFVAGERWEMFDMLDGLALHVYADKSVFPADPAQLDGTGCRNITESNRGECDLRQALRAWRDLARDEYTRRFGPGDGSYPILVTEYGLNGDAGKEEIAERVASVRIVLQEELGGYSPVYGNNPFKLFWFVSRCLSGDEHGTWCRRQVFDNNGVIQAPVGTTWRDEHGAHNTTIR